MLYRRLKRSGFLAVTGYVAVALSIWLMNGQVGPCGPASVRGAIGLLGLLIAALVAFGSTIWFLGLCFLSMPRRNRTG